MKGYIYLLKEKGHKTTYKIGRTNDLKRRLEQYNNGKTNIPDCLLENEGDKLPPKRFSQLDEVYKQSILKNNDPNNIQKILKDEVLVQMCNRYKKEYQFEYLHTVKVKDCIEAERILKDEVLDDDWRSGMGFQSEWFGADDTAWVISIMNDIGETVNKRKYKMVKVLI